MSDERDIVEELRSEVGKEKARATANWKDTQALWEVLIPRGPRCRDCADCNGRCQDTGPPCDPQEHALENAKLYSAAYRPAADEIERLRAEVARLEGNMTHVNTCDMIMSRVVGKINEINFVFADIKKMQTAFDALKPRAPS